MPPGNGTVTAFFCGLSPECRPHHFSSVSSSTMKYRLALELMPISSALNAALHDLPAPVRPVAAHIFGAGGKRLRPFLTVLMARLLGYAGKDIYDLAISMEMLHAATLLHDDVLDNAVTRRGKPAAHTVFGITPVVLAGDALLAAANQRVARHNDIRLTACFSEATARTAAGEIREIAYMHRVDQTPEIYLDIVEGKTAWLLRASCMMGALKAGGTEDQIAAAAQYGREVGMAFQMVDDAIDFAPTELTGKPVAGDVREGKLTPPLQDYRASLDSAERAAFDSAFTRGSFTEEECRALAARIRDAGFDVATRQRAGVFLEAALRALDRLPPGKEQHILRQMVAYVQNREK